MALAEAMKFVVLFMLQLCWKLQAGSKNYYVKSTACLMQEVRQDDHNGPLGP